MIRILYLSILLNVIIETNSKNETCTYEEFFIKYFESNKNPNLYILYEVNPPEGFNLRRDVYIRMGVFLKNLKKREKFKSTKLVLPPFTKLYHWKSKNLEQNFLTWKNFFDIKSLQAYTDVIDYDDFLEELELSFDDALAVDQIYQLQHFKEMFETGVFVDKFRIEKCDKNKFNIRPLQEKYNLIEKKFSCLKFQGNTKLLRKLVNFAYKNIKSRPATILFLNTEIVLHERWGDEEYWMARRSMRFNKILESIAYGFRSKHFNSTNENDLVQRPDNWIDEKYYRNAKGGNYLCVHLRRGDFLYGREHQIPTIKSAAAQIKTNLENLNLKKVFLASDCTENEFIELKSYLKDFFVYRFNQNDSQIILKDGQIAIIDQIICSYARYFMGTFESTFTFRIQEEREILGFRKNLTFNTLCKNSDLSNCQRNSVWSIVY